METQKERRESPGADFFQSAWKLLLDEPAKAAAVAYVWLTAVGYARLFGEGIHFDLNVLDYASPSDFLLAGLRDPLVPVLAFVTGLVLLRVWLAGRTKALWRWLLGPLTVTLLFLTLLGNGWYRKMVVDGALKDESWAPVPTELTFGNRPEIVGDLRLIVATGEFLIWFPPETEVPRRVLVVPRSEVKSIRVNHRHGSKN